jgi:hypothetical protein
MQDTPRSSPLRQLDLTITAVVTAVVTISPGGREVVTTFGADTSNDARSVPEVVIYALTQAAAFLINIGFAPADVRDVAAVGAVIRRASHQAESFLNLLNVVHSHRFPTHFRTVIRSTPSSCATTLSGVPSAIESSAAMRANSSAAFCASRVARSFSPAVSSCRRLARCSGVGPSVVTPSPIAQALPQEPKGSRRCGPGNCRCIPGRVHAWRL